MIRFSEEQYAALDKLHAQLAAKPKKRAQTTNRPIRTLTLRDEIYLPIATVSLLNVREHWAKRARRAKLQRQEAYTLTANLKVPQGPFTVILTRVSVRPLDTDNLAASFKSVRDGIADRIGIDDGDPRVTWHYMQFKGLAGEKAVIVSAVKK